MFFSLYQRVKEIWRHLRPEYSMPLRSNRMDIRLLHKIKGRYLPNLRQFFHISHVLTSVEKKALLASFLVLLLGLGWLAGRFVSEHRLQVPVNGGTYVEAVVGAPQFINPIFATTNDADMDIVRLVYSGLLRYDEQHRLVPDLAVKYSVSEDKKVYTFELRRDVVWHDNEPLTAQDVVFTIETIQNFAVGSPLFVTFQGVDIEAVDDYTVKLTLQEQFPSFLLAMTTGILPEHIWFDVRPEQMRLVKINLQPIGTGPFKFKKFLKDDAGHIYRYELERFVRYYRNPAFLDQLVFQFYPDYQGEVGAIKAFREQKVQGLSFVPHAFRDKVERKNINIHTLQLPQYTALFFNQSRHPALGDKNVRLALAHALDKERILRDVLQNNGQLIDSPILPNFPGYDPDTKKISFSYEKANELLDKSWPRILVEEYAQWRRAVLLKEWEIKHQSDISVSSSDPGTPTSTLWKEAAEKDVEQQMTGELQAAQTFYRRNNTGIVLDLTIVTVNSVENKKVAELAAGFWQGVGVKTNLKFVEPKDIYREVLKPREYDVLLYGEIVGNDPDPFPFWHSSQVDYPGLNLSRYVNRAADSVMEKIRGTASQEAAAPLYRKFQDVILDDLPAVFLYMPTYTYATTNELNGIKATQISHPSDRFSGVANWYMKTSGQWHF